MCKKMMITNNNVNLCDSCKYTYPDCSADEDDILFGDGIGKDNICCCNSYQAKLPDNTVSKGVYEQVVWERDVAIEQLKELGYGFGEKIRYDDDAVSRQMLIRHYDSGDFKHIMLLSRDTLLDYIKHMPSVSPKQKIGEWRINSDGYYPYCSECKEEPKNREMTKYCPNCGAKMT